MKTQTKTLFLVPVMIIGLGLILAGRVTAQTFTVLYSFAGSSGDGGNPLAGLITSGNILYGTTDHGGGFGEGTVFAVNTDGTGFTNLQSLEANPDGTMTLSGNTLYGTTIDGGSSVNGTVFALHTDGTGF